MFDNSSSPSPLKRRRLIAAIEVMESEAAKAKLAAIKDKLGRNLRVLGTSELSPRSNQQSDAEESEDYYEFTAEDYYHIMATRKEDKYLKMRKIREAEEAARKSKLTEAVIRVRFPDNHTLEAGFHPSEKIQNLYDLLMKVIARPEVPFYIYTTPPKKQITDLSQDFYSAGFVPGAIVYFSYDLSQGPFLQEEIMRLKGLDVIPEPEGGYVQSATKPVMATAVPAPIPHDTKPAEKNFTKPKWLRM